MKIGFFGLLFLVLMTLKFCNIITWCWPAIFILGLLPILVWLFCIIVVLSVSILIMWRESNG
jgi:hypothetical protein